MAYEIIESQPQASGSGGDKKPPKTALSTAEADPRPGMEDIVKAIKQMDINNLMALRTTLQKELLSRREFRARELGFRGRK